MKTKFGLLNISKIAVLYLNTYFIFLTIIFLIFCILQKYKLKY